MKCTMKGLALFGAFAIVGCAHPQASSKSKMAGEGNGLPPPQTQPQAPGAGQGEGGSGVAEGDNTLFFDYDAAALTDQSEQKLQQVASKLQQNPKEKVRIEGNCDERGTAEYNLALGSHRAEAAKKYLSRLGVSAKRVSTVSYGSERPKAQGHDESSWSQNRRDDLVLR